MIDFTGKAVRLLYSINRLPKNAWADGWPAHVCEFEIDRETESSNVDL